MRAIVTTAASHSISDAEIFEQVECLLSRRPTIGEVRRKVEFLPRRLKVALRPLLEAQGYGEALS